MLLVDAALKSAGSMQGCAREEVEDAVAYLTSPNVGAGGHRRRRANRHKTASPLTRPLCEGQNAQQDHEQNDNRVQTYVKGIRPNPVAHRQERMRMRKPYLVALGSNGIFYKQIGKPPRAQHSIDRGAVTYPEPPHQPRREAGRRIVCAPGEADGEW